MPKPPAFHKETALTKQEAIAFYDPSTPFANVYPAPITYGGVRYVSAEQAYHAAKFDDPQVLALIMAATGPVDSKHVANAHKHLIRPNWDQIKLRVMTRIVLAKMLQHPEIAEQLLATGNAYLFEDTPDTWPDPVWGMTTDAEGMVDGCNFMGRILMIVRDKLRAEG